MKNNKAKISENLGRIFEVGFNIGILAYIEGNGSISMQVKTQKLNANGPRSEVRTRD